MSSTAICFCGFGSFKQTDVKERLDVARRLKAEFNNSINMKTLMLFGPHFAVRKGLFYLTYELVLVFPPKSRLLNVAVALKCSDPILGDSEWFIRGANFFGFNAYERGWEPVAPSKVFTKNKTAFGAYAAVTNLDLLESNSNCPEKTSAYFAVKFLTDAGIFDPLKYLPPVEQLTPSKPEVYMFSKIEDLEDQWSGGNYQLCSGEADESARRVFRVNSAVLAAKSEYFRDFFTSASEDWTEKSGQTMAVSYSGEVLYACLQFIYVNRVADNLHQLMPEILDAANYFQLAPLKAACERLMVEQLLKEHENWVKAVDYLVLADRYDFKVLKRVCMLVVIDKMEEFQRSANFADWMKSTNLMQLYNDMVTLSAQMLRAAPDSTIASLPN